MLFDQNSVVKTVPGPAGGDNRQINIQTDITTFRGTTSVEILKIHLLSAMRDKDILKVNSLQF